MGEHKTINGFYSENLKYISIYLSKNNFIETKVYNSDFTKNKISTVYKPNLFGNKIFFKGIHLKGEIGFFIYFKSDSIQYPSFSILECDDELNMNTYLNYEIKDIKGRTFDYNSALNNIIKLNNFQICYISINT